MVAHAIAPATPPATSYLQVFIQMSPYFSKAFLDFPVILFLRLPLIQILMSYLQGLRFLSVLLAFTTFAPKAGPGSQWTPPHFFMREFSHFN